MVINNQAKTNFDIYVCVCVCAHVYQVVGAFWYLLSIEQADKCWRDVCKSQRWSYRYLYCGEDRDGKSVPSKLNASCPFIDPKGNKDTVQFDFGIYADALTSGIVEFNDFSSKIVYCFWWGLRNLRFVTLLQYFAMAKILNITS